MKLGTIVDSYAALNDLLKFNFPMKEAWDLGKLLDRIEREAKRYNKIRDEKITFFGELNEKGVYSIPPNHVNMPKFIEAMNELNETEVEIRTPVITDELLFSLKDINGNFVSFAPDKLKLLSYLILEGPPVK